MNFKVCVLFLCYPKTLKVFFFFLSLFLSKDDTNRRWGVGVEGSDSERDPTLQNFYGYTHQPNHPPLPLVGLSQEGTTALSCIFCGLINNQY